jgi:hypothetical protein
MSWTMNRSSKLAIDLINKRSHDAIHLGKLDTYSQILLIISSALSSRFYLISASAYDEDKRCSESFIDIASLLQVVATKLTTTE